MKKLALKRLRLEFSYPTKPVLFSPDYNVEELAKETKKVIIEGKFQGIIFLGKLREE